MPKTLGARVRFLTQAEGGRSAPALNGVRPHLKLGEVLTSCVVRGATEGVFELGTDYDVSIEILFWDEFEPFFCPDVPLELLDETRLIARGQWKL
jgi:hypothetical protein